MAESYIGLMSGTSMDGIDAVLADLSSQQPVLLNTHHHPWPPGLHRRLQAVAQGQALSAAEFAQLDADAGVCFAQAAQAVMPAAGASAIRAIGSHGQTVAHAPDGAPGYSLQLGNPHLIAEHTGITTVADFRRRDVAAYGQGAPLVPAFHQALFHRPGENRVILNIGGIANLTWLAGTADSPVTGFDTGPGNCLLDTWVQQQTGRPFDAQGDFARAGACQSDLLQRWLQDPYFVAPAPKSTGTDYFSSDWLTRQCGATYQPADVQATLVALTVQTITQAIMCHYPATDRVLACGGGWHNPVLRQALTDALPCPLESTEAHGLAPDWVEATAFAWLAQQRLHKLPGNLPDVTGASGPRLLGVIYAGDADLHSR
ncbi:MAG: anhydro-N-acetylmuramic acid kinase [Pseudomonadota bacterium]